MRWEYTVTPMYPPSTEFSEGGGVKEAFARWWNPLGAEGWELVAVVAGFAYFKRPLEAA